MAPRSKVETLPADVRAWLDRALADNNFAGYEQLEALLGERGYAIGKSSINRYGQKLQQRLAAIKASTEAARLISETTADEKDARSEAIIALVQTELFDTIINLQEAANEEDQAERVGLLSAAAKNIATMTRASIALKKHQAEVRAQVLAEAAANVETAARAQGMDEDQVRFWREKVLGIA